MQQTTTTTVSREEGIVHSKGYAAKEPKTALEPFEFERRPVGDNDVLINIKYCGVCHSDIHTARSEWRGTKYPVVPGHEIVGEIVQVGKSVSKFKVGDRAGVGCMVDSCKKCDHCLAGQEEQCSRTVWTYNSPEGHIGGNTYGGYSSNIVVDENFALRISPDVDLASAAPLLCAGITTYSPLRRWKVGPGMKVGIVGLGGLGHMAVKLAHSMGAHVTVFTTSPSKKEDARRLGADDVVVSSDKAGMDMHAAKLDFVLDTVSANHDIDTYLSLLKHGGAMVIVGLPTSPHTVAAESLVHWRRILAGSVIGGIKETQEMLDYCAQNGVSSDIELIPIQRINEAFERTVKGDVKYRFVIDMSSLGK
jgi:uncharacterized zinc-type alcohol dehydrogenase-like protein